MSITADREVYALETRSESLETISVGDFLRQGECDEIDVGTGTYLDNVQGNENSRYGTLEEIFDHQLSRECDRYSHAITGDAKFDGTDDMWMVTGGMADTEAGGSLHLGGQSDVLCGISGMRVTMLSDLWIAGLMGMEEKIATAIQDLVTIEFGGLQFEREYGVGNHIGGYSYQAAADSDVTVANSFRPLFKHVTGVRDYTPAAAAQRAQEKAEKKAAKAEKKAAAKAAKADKAANAGNGSGIFSSFNFRRRLFRAVSVGEAAEDAADLHHVSKVDNVEKAEDAAAAVQRIDDILDAAADAASKPEYDFANKCTNSGPLEGMPRWEIESQQSGLRQQGNSVEWTNGKWQTKPGGSSRPQFDPYESLDDLDFGPPPPSGRTGGGSGYEDIADIDIPPPSPNRKPSGSGYEDIGDIDGPPGPGGRQSGGSGYEDIGDIDGPSGSTSGSGTAPDPDAIYGTLDKPTIPLDPDAPPLPDRHNLSAGEIDNLGKNMDSPPVPDDIIRQQEALAATEKWQDLIQSNEYRRYIESHGLEVKWDDGWHPVIDEDAGIVPKVGDFEYRNGEWVKGDTAVTTAEFKTSAGAAGPDTWGPLFDEHGYCITPGPYYGQPRVEVLEAAEGMKIKYQVEIEWVDGDWQKVPPDVTGPKFNQQNICTSPGPFYGRPRTEVDATKNLLEADGFKVKWEDGEWKRVQGTGPTAGGGTPTAPTFKNGVCMDEGPNKGASVAEVNDWKLNRESGGQYKVEWIDGDWRRVGPGDATGGGTPPSGVTAGGDVPTGSTAPTGGVVSPDGGPRFDGNKLCVDDGPFKNQPDYRVAEYKRNISENGKYEVEWVNGTWQRVASTAETVGDAGADASKATSPVFDTSGRCIAEGRLKGATRSEVDSVKHVQSASGQYKVEWIDGTWQRTADLADTDEVDYQDFRRIFGHPRFDANGNCIDEGPFKGLSKDQVYSEFRRIHGVEAEYMETIVWCNGTWMYEEDAYRRLSELGAFDFTMQSGPQFDIHGFCMSDGPFKGTFWDTVWQAEWDMLDDNKQIEWVNGNWVDTSAQGSKITENFENAAETGGAVTAATRPPPQTGADRMHHGNVYMAPGDNVAPPLPSRSQNFRFRGTRKVDAMKPTLQGRDPGTFQRLQKLQDLSEMSSKQISEMELERISFNKRILKGDKKLKAGNKGINEALQSLNETVEATGDKNWWQSAQDMRVKMANRDERAALSAADDGRHMVDSADDSMNWVEHLDELMDDGYAKIDNTDSPVVRQVDDHRVPNKMQVFGCVNPALEPGQRIPDVPAYSAPFVGGTDGKYLLPQVGNSSEHVKATSVVEAVQGLDKQQYTKVYGIEIDNVEKMQEIHRKLLEQIARRKIGVSQVANAAEDAASGGQNIGTAAADAHHYQELEAVLTAAKPALEAAQDTAASGEDLQYAESLHHLDEIEQIEETEKAGDLAQSDVLQNMAKSQDSAAPESSWQPASEFRRGSTDEDNYALAGPAVDENNYALAGPAVDENNYALLGPPSPVLDESGPTWGKTVTDEDNYALLGPSTDVPGATGTTRPTNIQVDRDIVVMGPDGSISMQKMGGGEKFDYDNWMEELSNAAPPKMAGGGSDAARPVRPPSGPSRTSKIKEWFDGLGARLRKLMGNSAEEDPDWVLLAGDDAYRYERIMLTNNTPPKMMGQVSGSQVDDVITTGDDLMQNEMLSLNSKLQSEGIAGLADSGLRHGDALQDSSDGMRGWDNGMRLEDSGNLRQADSLEDGASGARPAEAAADSHVITQSGLTEAEEAARLEEVMSTMEDSFGAAQKYDDKMLSINLALSDTANDGSRAALGTVAEARIMVLDEIQERSVLMIAAIDPNATEDMMGIGGYAKYEFQTPRSQLPAGLEDSAEFTDNFGWGMDLEKASEYASDHPVEKVFDWVQQQHRLAAQAEDVHLANQWAEMTELMASYLEEGERFVKAYRKQGSKLVRQATTGNVPFDSGNVLARLYRDPEYNHYLNVIDAHPEAIRKIPNSAGKQDMFKYLPPITTRGATNMDVEYGKAIVVGQVAMQRGQDPRAVLSRHIESAAMLGESTEVEEAYRFALTKFDEAIGAECDSTLGFTPSPYNNDIVSMLTQGDLDAAFNKLDALEGDFEPQYIGQPAPPPTAYTPPVDSPPISGAVSPAESTVSAADSVADVTRPMTEHEAVSVAVAGDFPVMNIVGGETDAIGSFQGGGGMQDLATMSLDPTAVAPPVPPRSGPKPPIPPRPRAKPPVPPRAGAVAPPIPPRPGGSRPPVPPRSGAARPAVPPRPVVKPTPKPRRKLYSNAEIVDGSVSNFQLNRGTGSKVSDRVRMLEQMLEPSPISEFVANGRI